MFARVLCLGGMILLDVFGVRRHFDMFGWFDWYFGFELLGVGFGFPWLLIVFVGVALWTLYLRGFLLVLFCESPGKVCFLVCDRFGWIWFGILGCLTSGLCCGFLLCV